ncbi:MAG: FAD-dependent oxidoreductase [Fervidicoccaceae archaeon]
MSKKIVILGGGAGGVVAALALADAKRKHNLDMDIVVINRDEWHYMPPLWMDIALEGISIDETRAPLYSLESYGVKFVKGEATKIDPEKNSVHLNDGRTMDYEYLFVTLGLRNGWDAIPGYERAGFHNYEPESALELNKAIRNFRGGKVVLTVPELPFRCGIYPMEFSTVLGHKFQVRGIKAEILILSPKIHDGRDISWALGKDIGNLWQKYFEKHQIEIKTHDGIERVDDERKLVITRNYEENYDLLIKVPPPRPPKVLEDPVFLFDEDKRFVKARTKDFRHPEHENIFLTGEHSMPPVGLGTAGVFVDTATYKAATLFLNEQYGVEDIHEIHPVACVAYCGDKGFLGLCEIELKGEKYDWSNCYNIAENFAMRLVKRGFYKGWLDRFKF